MRALAAMTALLAMSACDRKAETGPEPKTVTTPAAAPSTGANDTATAATSGKGPAPLESEADAASAAATVRRYFDLIGQRQFDDAWRLRLNGGGVTAEQFASSYGAYRDYHATVGTPSEPQRSGFFLFVEVPVQIYGLDQSGKPFGSAGTITLRRDAQAPDHDQGWRIYTSG